MTSSIIPFEFDSIDVRGIADENGSPWLVGKDVAEALGYSRPDKAVLNHVDYEDQQTFHRLEPAHTETMEQNDPLYHGDTNRKLPNGINKATTLINESGLYSLILASKKPAAKRFKRWVTATVLPNIRKHGAHINEDATAEGIHNAMTPDQRLDLYSKGLDLLDRLGMVTDWDRQMYGDRIREATLDTEPSQTQNKKQYWTIADAAEEIGITLDRSQAMKAGRKAAKSYRQYYGESPHEIIQMVNGAQRNTKAYGSRDLRMVQDIIRELKQIEEEALNDPELRKSLDDLMNQ